MIESDAFSGVTATAGYPHNRFWVAADLQNYGGSLTWVMNDVVHDGECGPGLRWVITDAGVLDIYGMGRMYNYDDPAEPEGTLAPWTDMSAEITSIHIGRWVRSIGSYAFAACENASELSLLAGIPAISDTTFSGRQMTVTYPAGELSYTAETMKDYGGTLTWVAVDITRETLAAGTCGDNLRWVLYEDGELVISGEGEMDYYSEGSAPWYEYASKIKAATLGSGVISIGSNAFANCGRMAVLSLPEGLTRIGYSAFSNCARLDGVVLPDSLTEIGYGAFYRCSSLTAIRIPAGITSLRDALFEQCSNLQTVELPDGLETIESCVFANTAIQDIQLPESVTSIGGSAFCECRQLNSVRLGDNVEILDAWAFSYCFNLQEIKLSAKLKTIHDHTFNDCYNLREITIPAEVVSIQNCAFSSNSNLQTIRFEGSAPSIDANVFEGVTATVYYPAEKDWTAADRRDYGGNLTWVGSHVVNYDANTGEGAPLEQIKYPGEELLLSDVIPTHGRYRFIGWNEQADAAGVTYMPNEAYTKEESMTLYAIWALPDFILPSALTVIDSEAFAGGAFRFVMLPERVTALHNRAFADCPALSVVCFTGSETVIDENAFGDRTKLTVLGPRDSTAEAFAAAHSFDFVPLA